MDDHRLRPPDVLELSSAEFRRTYAKLRKPTTVTANGHVIGQWIPTGSATYALAKLGDGLTVHGLKPPRDTVAREPEEGDPTFRFSSRPFTPVPKRGK